MTRRRRVTRRPAGPEELALVEASGWREWPPRLPGQPMFYPVLNEEYAARIARDWNVPASAPGTSPGSRSCGRSWTTTRSTRPGKDHPRILDPRRRSPRPERQHRRHNRGNCGVPLTSPQQQNSALRLSAFGVPGRSRGTPDLRKSRIGMGEAGTLYS